MVDSEKRKLLNGIIGDFTYDFNLKFIFFWLCVNSFIICVNYVIIEFFIHISSIITHFIFNFIFLLFEILIILQFVKIKKTQKALLYINDKRSNFLANFSHELRTPLNSIIGFSDLLLDGVDNPKECIEIINSSSKHLLDLINDILDISKIQVGQIDLIKSESSISELIINCINTFKNQKEIIVNNTLPIEYDKIMIDRRRIMQILINLLNNAIKFTPFDKKIGIIIEKVDNFILFTIWDEGIGIKDDSKRYIFTPFYQANSSMNKKFQGTGLGLSICKSIIEKHNGNIWFESKFNEGSKFHFTLPIYFSQHNTTHAETFLESLWHD